MGHGVHGPVQPVAVIGAHMTRSRKNSRIPCAVCGNPGWNYLNGYGQLCRDCYDERKPDYFAVNEKLPYSMWKNDAKDLNDGPLATLPSVQMAPLFELRGCPRCGLGDLVAQASMIQGHVAISCVQCGWLSDVLAAVA